MSLGATTSYSGGGTAAPQPPVPGASKHLLGVDLSASSLMARRRTPTPPPPIVVSQSTSHQLPTAHSIDDEMEALLRDAGVTQREIRIRRKKVPGSPRRSIPSPSPSPAPPSPRELLPYERDDSPSPPSSASSRNSGVWPGAEATSPPVSPKRASMIRRKPTPLLDAALAVEAERASATPPPRSPTHTPPVLLSVPGPGMPAIALPAGAGQLKRPRPAPFAAFSPPPPPADEPDAPYSPITVRPASWQRPSRTLFGEYDDGSAPAAPKSAPATIARRGQQQQQQRNAMEAVHEVDARVTVPPTPPPEPVAVLPEAAAAAPPRAEPTLPRSETMPARPPLSSADSSNSIKSLPEWLAAKPVRSSSGDGAPRSHLPRSASISSKLAIVVPSVPEEEPMPAAPSMITSPREASPATTPVAPASPTFGTVTVPEPEPMPVPMPAAAPTRGPRSPLRVTGLPHGAKRLSGSSLDGEHTDSEYFSEVSEKPAPAVPAPGSTVSALDSEIRTPTGATFHSGTVDEEPSTVRRAYRVSRVETEPSTSDEERDDDDDEEYASAEDHLQAPVARVEMPVPRPLASPATVRSEPVGEHVRAVGAGVPKPRSLEDSAVGAAGTLHPGSLPARKVSLANNNLTPTSSKGAKMKGSVSSRSAGRRAPTTTHGLDYEAFEDEYPSDDSVEPKQSGKSKSLPFSVFRAPSARTLWEASQRTVTDDEGKKVAFGDLFPSYDGGAQKTVMVFVRHFWCGACQNYMEFSLANVDPEIVRQHNIRVVLIGCGSWKAIKAYKALFNCQYEMYTDRSRKIYKLMG
ncbi:Thioredoxin-like protein AAED1 [Vanrija pseudolonga]|uniref:Thioredoxin-like protein AAED1 n=1 Tax=Vanrija pseudolonga TaxID=143232 RepID=A0AAF1BGQ0_9TREE|nr:Thioredoxin-like protein AAED1 [Vanrija pseudolonga]